MRGAQLSLPFGMRVPDGYLFGRDLTQGARTRSVNDSRVLPYGAISVKLDPLAEVRNQTSTPDPYRERGYTGFVKYALSSALELGVSARLTQADADRVYLAPLATTRVVANLFARLRLARALAIAGEVGAQDSSRRELGYAAQLQLDVTLLEGVRLLGTAQLSQCGARSENGTGAELQPGAWVTLDWLIARRFETRLDAIRRDDAGTSLLARFTTYF